jgi:hypothetical protein
MPHADDHIRYLTVPYARRRCGRPRPLERIQCPGTGPLKWLSSPKTFAQGTWCSAHCVCISGPKAETDPAMLAEAVWLAAVGVLLQALAESRIGDSVSPAKRASVLPEAGSPRRQALYHFVHNPIPAQSGSFRQRVGPRPGHPFTCRRFPPILPPVFRTCVGPGKGSRFRPFSHPVADFWHSQDPRAPPRQSVVAVSQTGPSTGSRYLSQSQTDAIIGLAKVSRTQDWTMDLCTHLFAMSRQ